MKALPVKKTNKSGVPRIKFVDINILEIMLVSRLAKREDYALILISTILKFPALKTLELDTLYPDRLIWISTVETYHFLNPLFWYTPIDRILGTLVDTDYNNLKTNKKRRLSIDLNTHNSKVFSSDYPRCEFTEECTKDEDCGGSDRDSRYI